MAMTGSFCTSVLRTTDPDRAVAFYGPLVGSTAHAAAPNHTFLKHGSMTVASIHRIDTGRDEWVPHVLVEHIEMAVVDATELGATLVDQQDVEGVARIATMRDLEGAAFGLWQAAPHAGAELTDVLGSIWWVELMALDPAVGRDFYGRLFGWTVRETSFEPIGLYRVFERPPTQEGGLNQESTRNGIWGRYGSPSFRSRIATARWRTRVGLAVRAASSTQCRNTDASA